MADIYSYNSGQYGLTVTSGSSSTHRESEVNDTNALADIVSLGSSVVGQLSTAQDIDTYSVLMPADGTLMLSFDGPTSNNVSNYFQVSVFNASGLLIAARKTGGDVALDAKVSVAGTYYVQVRTADSYYSGGDYTLGITGVLVESIPTGAIVGTTMGDRLTGTAADDVIYGLGGNDQLDGRAGNDVLRGGDGFDTMTGGDGFDVADYRGLMAVKVNLASGTATQGDDTDTLVSIEAIFGSSANDTFRGLDGAANLPGETFRGNGGHDTIDGGSGIDRAEFSGSLASYSITRAAGAMGILVAHNNGGSDGSDSLSNVELLLFNDRVVGFGPRVEDVARVAFALWTPAIYNSPTLFSKGISFYTNQFGNSFDTLCLVALQYHPETGLGLANKLKGSIPASSYSAQQLVDIMVANGGATSDAGRAAAVKAVALEAATNQQLELMGVTSKGVEATLNFDTEIYFGLLPG